MIFPPLPEQSVHDTISLLASAAPGREYDYQDRLSAFLLYFR